MNGAKDEGWKLPACAKCQYVTRLTLSKAWVLAAAPCITWGIYRMKGREGQGQGALTSPLKSVPVAFLLPSKMSPSKLSDEDLS